MKIKITALISGLLLTVASAAYADHKLLVTDVLDAGQTEARRGVRLA